MTTTEVSVDEAIDRLLADHPPATTPEVEFWGAQFDAGLAWVHFPVGLGGLGVSPSYQVVVSERLAAAGVSTSNQARNVIGQGMAAPTVLTHGTPEQKERWLRPLFTAEEVWCQLFSEPSAGSDVAGLATRAVKDGDEWIVNGQKVWTTLAHTARWGLLVARTDPDQPKHRGLTYFVIDMDQPGVEVRPLRQITGEAEFNEVYFTDARIPDAYRLDGVGEGWRVSLTTLMNERVAIGSSIPARGEGAIAMALDLWETYGGEAAARDRLMELWVSAEVLRLTSIRAAEARTAGTPGAEGSTGKLHWAELNKRIYSFCVDLMGAEGMLYPETYAFRTPEESAMGRRSPQMNFLRSRANSIEGGTSEIMKNILGERVLGLPGEPRLDKDLPWREVPLADERPSQPPSPLRFRASCARYSAHMMRENGWEGASAVLVTHPLPAGAGEGLDENWVVWDGDAPMPREELMARVADIDGLLCMLVDEIDAELIAAGRSLKVISQMSVGVDNVDLSAATAAGIPVGHTPGVLTETTADTAFALLAAAARRLPEGAEALRRGHVGEWDPELLMGSDLGDTTIGIVGLGRIGQAVARRASGFGMRILYSGPRPKPEADGLGAEHVELEELVRQADHVVITAPLTEDTFHLFDRSLLGRLKDGATLVNVARGGLIDHEALVEVADSGSNPVALDVTDPEPLPTHHPLLALANVLVIPHLGSSSVRTRRAMADLSVANLRAGLAGQPLAACANPDVYAERQF